MSDQRLCQSQKQKPHRRLYQKQRIRNDLLLPHRQRPLERKRLLRNDLLRLVLLSKPQNKDRAYSVKRSRLGTLQKLPAHRKSNKTSRGNVPSRPSKQGRCKRPRVPRNHSRPARRKPVPIRRKDAGNENKAYAYHWKHFSCAVLPCPVFRRVN